VTPFVVVPAHDEATTVGDVVGRARTHAPVIVVDDGSTDGTAHAAAAAGAQVHRHPRRLGKAQALQTGAAAARARGATHVISLDADGQHDPDDIPALLRSAAPRTLVIGARARGNRALPAGRAEAVVVAGFFVRWASGLRLADTQSGFRVYPVAIFDEVPARHGGFVFETEVLLAAAARGFTVREVPVRSLPRVAARSRFRPVVDGVAIGAYLGRRALARAARDASAAAGELAALASASRTRERHAAMLEDAVPYIGGAAWGPMMGVMAVRRAGGRVAGWWRHPRGRRAATATTAVLALPLVLPALALAALTGVRLAPVSALVATLYAQARLDGEPGTARMTPTTVWTRP